MNQIKSFDELKDTYWGQIITIAEQKNCFSSKNVSESRHWVTCACGRVTVDIPRFKETVFLSTSRHWVGEPKDNELRELGTDFSLAVGGNNYDWAKQLLVQIENRARKIATLASLSTNV